MTYSLLNVGGNVISINFNQYHGFIFDMDGTLLDTMPAHLAAWQATAEQFGFPFDATWLYGLGGMPSAKIVQQINHKLNMTLDPEQVAAYKMAQFAKLGLQADLIPATYQLLCRWHGQKKMAIGTGSQRASALGLLTRAQVVDKFDVIVSASDVTEHKPHPETFLSACEQMGLQPKQCLVFEDTQLGMQAAHAGGMDCVLVSEQGLAFYPASASASAAQPA
ncbi:MAG: beta-phosphoglucomutase family hydrolase [Vibrio sp.]